MLHIIKYTLTLLAAFATIHSYAALSVFRDQKERSEVRKPFDESRITQLPRDIQLKILKEFISPATLFPRLWAKTLTISHVLNIIPSDPNRLIQSVSFSDDGKYMVVADNAGATSIWDVQRKTLICSFQTNHIQSATFSNDGSQILTTHSNNAAYRIWNTGTGDLISELQEHNQPIQAATFYSDTSKVITVHKDGTLCLWDTKAKKILEKIKIFTYPRWVLDIAFSRDGKYMAILEEGGAIDICDFEDTKRYDSNSKLLIPQSCIGHYPKRFSISFNSDGTQLVASEKSFMTPRVYYASIIDIQQEKILATSQDHDYYVRTAFFSPDDTCTITASNDGTARISNAKNGRTLRTLESQSEFIHCAIFSSRGDSVVTTYEPGIVRFWESTFDYKKLTHNQTHLLSLLEKHTQEADHVSLSLKAQRTLASFDEKTQQCIKQVYGITQRTEPSIKKPLLIAAGTAAIVGAGTLLYKYWKKKK